MRLKKLHVKQEAAMTLLERQQTIMAEAKQYPAGSDEWQYRMKTAWTWDQMRRGVPANDWTDWPPHWGATGPLKEAA